MIDLKNLKDILDWIGYASTAYVILQVIGLMIAIWKGILPSLFRLGIGLSKRKIAILANSEMGNSLRDLLVDSGLFQNKNVFIVSNKKDIGKLERVNSILMHWESWKDTYESVLNVKTDGCSLIIYAPADEGKISEECYKELDEKRNVIVTNFRGRLLNDIVNSMITSGYVK